MSSGKRPVPGKKKKAKKKAEFPWVPVLAGVVGMIIALSLMGGGYYVLKQRQIISNYNESITKVREIVGTHDPDKAGKGLNPSDITPLIVGNPKESRETKDGVNYIVYTWREGSSPVGIRLHLEKAGATEEVVEWSTLGHE